MSIDVQSFCQNSTEFNTVNPSVEMLRNLNKIPPSIEPLFNTEAFTYDYFLRIGMNNNSVRHGQRVVRTSQFEVCGCP